MPSLQELLMLIIALLVTISVHEAAHAWVANYLGDPTAKHAGRMTLNPLKHLDPLGTIALFLVHFGWGKPVPVNPYNLRNPKKDQAIISLAGPISNLATAAISAVIFKHLLLPLLGVNHFVTQLFGVIIDLNLILMLFNLIPIPPLDGSKVLFAFLPNRFNDAIARWERTGPMLLFAIIIISQLLNLNVFQYVLGYPLDFLRFILMKTS